MAAKTILVTGSSRGLGKSIAILFAKKKYNIIIHGRDEKRLEEVRRSILRNNVECDVVKGDLSSRKTIATLCEIAKRRNIDILINNAGIYFNKPFQNMTAADFKRVVNINLIVPIMIVQGIFPIFQKKKSGLIININSIAGKTGSDGESAYAASKHGLRGFTKSIQYEANKGKIRVLEFYLGAMNSTMVEGRRDPDKCISPDEVADLIYRISRDYPSLRVNEIDLSRRNY